MVGTRTTEKEKEHLLFFLKIGNASLFCFGFVGAGFIQGI